MNPCRCGNAFEPGYACKRGRIDRCTSDYQARISGPLMDRIDLRIEVPAVTAADLILPPPAEGSAEVAARVARRARHPARTLSGRRSAKGPHQCGSAGRRAGRDRKARRAGPKTVARCRRDHAAVGARLSPRAAGGAHARRPRRRQQNGRLHLAEALSYRALAEDVRQLV